MSERERQVMKRLKEVVDKQRDEIRAKDRELGLKNEDVEAVSDQLQSEPTFLLHGAMGAGPERWLSSKSICCSSRVELSSQHPQDRL